MNTNDKVRRDAYFCIHTTMQSGFECLIPARGYNLKSWLAFEERLGAKYEYDEITEQAYIHLMLGDPNDPLGEKYGPASERTAQQENPPKRSRGKAKVEDSPKPRTPRKTTTQAGKKSPVSCGNPQCVMCANPRKTFKELTIQEKRHLQNVEAQRDKRSNGIYESESDMYQ